MASFGRFTPGAGGVVETLSYSDPTLTLTQSAGSSPLTANIPAGGGVDGSGTANFVSKWSDTDTLADSLFFSDADVAKTIQGGADKGLYLDFANDNYRIGTFANHLQVDNPNFLIKTNFDEGDYGLFIDYNNGLISLNNGVEAKGLYLDFVNGIYGLGYTETGDWVGEPVFGFCANATTEIFTMGDAGSLLSENDLTLNSPETRFYINTNRTHLRNLTEEQIAALSAPLEGDIVYNVSSHHINYYNGTTWRKLLDGAQ